MRQRADAQRAAADVRWAAEVKKRQADAEAEKAAALKPQWRPLRGENLPQGWTAGQAERMNDSQRNLLRWTAAENGFRITSLNMPQNYGTGWGASRFAWSGDGRRLYLAGGGNYLMEISTEDWTVLRRAHLFPSPETVCFSNDSLVVLCNGGRQVLVIDPATFTPIDQLDLPVALSISRSVRCGGVQVPVCG